MQKKGFRQQIVEGDAGGNGGIVVTQADSKVAGDCS